MTQAVNELTPFVPLPMTSLLRQNDSTLCVYRKDLRHSRALCHTVHRTWPPCPSLLQGTEQRYKAHKKQKHLHRPVETELLMTRTKCCTWRRHFL
jgi:hypothetical protein